MVSSEESEPIGNASLPLLHPISTTAAITDKQSRAKSVGMDKFPDNGNGRWLSGEGCALS
jgi:hypothetical protein